MIAANQPDDDDTQGGGGALFNRPNNIRTIRSDARMAARFISLGVVSEERAAKILAGSFYLAEHAIENKDARSYASLMQVPIAVAKIVQAERHHADGENVNHVLLTEAERLERKQRILQEWFPDEPIILESANGDHAPNANGQTGPVNGRGADPPESGSNGNGH